jgi:glutathione synthase
MNLLFIADPLVSFKTYKDSTFAMMRTAAAKGHRLFACEMHSVRWARGGTVDADVQEIELTPDAPLWYRAVGGLDRGGTQPMALRDFDAVLMRKDPPFDSEYFYATHLLSQAEREGAKVFNRAASLRNHPEKLAILEFPHLIGPTLVTRSAADIRAFHAEHKDIILKPLDGMGGTGIFRVPEHGLNLGAIIETLNRFGAETVMVQKFLPKIAEGDKRILLIAGKPVPFCLARIPQGGEVRGNLAAGGKGVAQPLSAKDLEIANELAPILFQRGLLLVGLDVIGDCVTEINVTSPTGFQEITQQTGFDVANAYIKAIEAAQPTWG